MNTLLRILLWTRDDMRNADPAIIAMSAVFIALCLASVLFLFRPGSTTYFRRLAIIWATFIGTLLASAFLF